MCRIPRGGFYPPVGIGLFSTGIVLVKKKDAAQIFLRLYINELLYFLNSLSKYNRHYEIYISVTAAMQLFVVREIKLFKVK